MRFEVEMRMKAFRFWNFDWLPKWKWKVVGLILNLEEWRTEWDGESLRGLGWKRLGLTKL